MFFAIKNQPFEFLRSVGFLLTPSTGEFLQMDALFQRPPE